MGNLCPSPWLWGRAVCVYYTVVRTHNPAPCAHVCVCVTERELHIHSLYCSFIFSTWRLYNQGDTGGNKRGKTSLPFFTLSVFAASSLSFLPRLSPPHASSLSHGSALSPSLSVICLPLLQSHLIPPRSHGSGRTGNSHECTHEANPLYTLQ